MTASAVALAPRGLAAGGEVLPLVSGALHYFRIDAGAWGKCLRAARSLGFRMVESYVPWGVHERRKGAFDFTGRRDLAAFLDACAGEGLKVLLRPGPHVNAELGWFGLPERICADPAMQMKSGRGTPSWLMVPPRAFAVPSYASTKFLDEVRAWYGKVAEIVAPRLSPRGPVVALQVDNEHAQFFRAGAYDGDYHDEALAAWRTSHGDAEPPRRFDAKSPDELPPHLGWLAFREAQAQRALAGLTRMLDEAGLAGVPRYHNFPPHDPGVYDVAAAERVLDVAGIDLYHPRSQFSRIRRRALYLAGTSRLPYAPEMGFGSFPWGPPLDGADAIAQLGNALAHGVAGFNVYMLVERDRWLGSPIDVDGNVRKPLAEPLARIVAALDAAKWTELSRDADLAIVMPRGYGRLALASSHAGPIGPGFSEWLGLDELSRVSEARFGFDGPIALEQARWRRAVEHSLARAGLPWVEIDASAPVESLAKRRGLIVPTFDFLDADLAERLTSFAHAGGALLTGPRRPSRDETMAARSFDLPGGLLPSRGLDEPEALDGAIAELARVARARRAARSSDPFVEPCVHRRSDGSPAVVFVCNAAGEARSAEVTVDGASGAEDALEGEKFSGESWTVRLAPYSVRMLLVT